METDVARPALTERQAQALKYITDCLTDRGYPPTLREIGEHMGIKSTNGVNDHLKALERKGYLAREELKSRALRPIDVGEAANSRPEPRAIARDEEIEVPILGSVAAGVPILAEENISDRVVVDRHFLGAVKHEDVFGLVIKGDSMIEDGIFDGDYIFVRKQRTADRKSVV